MRPLAFGLLVREAHRSANGWRAARHRPGKPVSGATSRSGCYLRCRCQGQGPPWEPRRRRCLSFLGPPPAPPCGCCPGCSPVGRPRGPLPIRGRTRFAAGYFSCSNAGPGQPVGSAVALAVRAAVHTARSLPALVPPDWLPCSPAPAHRAESRLLLVKQVLPGSPGRPSPLALWCVYSGAEGQGGRLVPSDSGSWGAVGPVGQGVPGGGK